MSRWKKEDASEGAMYLREWTQTPKGEEYKKRQAEYAKEWRKNNKEKKKAIQQRSMYGARLKVLQHYTEKEIPECRCCKETIFEFLQIDHIKGDGAEHRRSIGMAQGDLNTIAKQVELTGRKPTIGGSGFIYWLIKNNFPEGFQVLCANCNYSKRNNKYCRHEILNKIDMYGNAIEMVEIEFPELTRRRRGEAEKEAEALGISVAALHARERAARKPKLEIEKIESTHCKNGHEYAAGNEYIWNGHKQCRQCKRDYKLRKKTENGE